jgi:hypothetical protein
MYYCANPIHVDAYALGMNFKNIKFKKKVLWNILGRGED